MFRFKCTLIVRGKYGVEILTTPMSAVCSQRCNKYLCIGHIFCIRSRVRPIIYRREPMGVLGIYRPMNYTSIHFSAQQGL